MPISPTTPVPTLSLHSQTHCSCFMQPYPLLSSRIHIHLSQCPYMLPPFLSLTFSYPLNPLLIFHVPSRPSPQCEHLTKHRSPSNIQITRSFPHHSFILTTHQKHHPLIPIISFTCMESHACGHPKHPPCLLNLSPHTRLLLIPIFHTCKDLPKPTSKPSIKVPFLPCLSSTWNRPMLETSCQAHRSSNTRAPWSMAIMLITFFSLWALCTLR